MLQLQVRHHTLFNQTNTTKYYNSDAFQWTKLNTKISFQLGSANIHLHTLYYPQFHYENTINK